MHMHTDDTLCMDVDTLMADNVLNQRAVKRLDDNFQYTIDFLMKILDKVGIYISLLSSTSMLSDVKGENSYWKCLFSQQIMSMIFI